jgi:amino acid transporter
LIATYWTRTGIKFYIFTLICFCLVGGYFILREPSMLAANWRASSEHHIGVALFFGFAAALLGISGFESSSNFIEEQKEGVFPKTLRNMWVTVTIFNPLICLLVLGVVPIASMQEHGEDLLAFSGARIAGKKKLSRHSRRELAETMGARVQQTASHKAEFCA